MRNLVIFASGAGSNAEAVIRFFAARNDIGVVRIFTNNPKAGVLKIAESHGIGSVAFSNDEFYGGRMAEILTPINPDLIILAGFLLKFPDDLIASFPGKIINIHPALLPKYGGKGMFGMHVHKAVADSGDAETGISIHYVNEHYDQGGIIFQKSIPVNTGDSCESIAEKVKALEHYWLPRTIEKLLS